MRLKTVFRYLAKKLTAENTSLATSTSASHSPYAADYQTYNTAGEILQSLPLAHPAPPVALGVMHRTARWACDG